VGAIGWALLLLLLLLLLVVVVVVVLTLLQSLSFFPLRTTDKHSQTHA